MSADFTPVLVKDSRIHSITDNIPFGVVKGGMNISAQSFNANSKSESQQTYNIVLPSENTLVSREIIWKQKIRFSASGTPAVGKRLIEYGDDCAFGAFPLNQQLETVQVVLNNNTVSEQSKDSLATLLQFMSMDDMKFYSTMTPTMPDQYKNYIDADKSNNDVMGGYKAGNLLGDEVPRGAHPIRIIPESELAGNTNPVSADGLTLITVVFEVEFAEPLFISPFAYFAGRYSSTSAMYGLSALNLTMNLDATCKRMFRLKSAIPNFSLRTLPNEGTYEIQLMLITPQSSDFLPQRNILPYVNLNRYTKSENGFVIAGASGSIQSPNISLSSIPDKLICVLRKKMSSQSFTDTDTFMAIKKINITFGNQTGICSSMTQEQLFKASVANGVNSNWLQWRGKTTNMVAGVNSELFLKGSVLALAFGKDINLQDYEAPGSIGQYNLNFSVEYENNSAEQQEVELLILLPQSGYISIERGISNTAIGLLSRTEILSVSQGESMGYSQSMRMMGSGWWSDRWSDVKAIGRKVIPSVRKALTAELPSYLANPINSYAESKGYGKSGGKKKGISRRVKEMSMEDEDY